MAHLDHRHTVGVVLTGPGVADGDRGHYHKIPGGSKTFTSQDAGPKHVHLLPGGKKTSGPLPLKKAKTKK